VSTHEVAVGCLESHAVSPRPCSSPKICWRPWPQPSATEGELTTDEKQSVWLFLALREVHPASPAAMPSPMKEKRHDRAAYPPSAWQSSWEVAMLYTSPPGGSPPGLD